LLSAAQAIRSCSRTDSFSAHAACITADTVHRHQSRGNRRPHMTTSTNDDWRMSHEHPPTRSPAEKPDDITRLSPFPMHSQRAVSSSKTQLLLLLLSPLTTSMTTSTTVQTRVAWTNDFEGDDGRCVRVVGCDGQPTGHWSCSPSATLL